MQFAIKRVANDNEMIRCLVSAYLALAELCYACFSDPMVHYPRQNHFRVRHNDGYWESLLSQTTMK